MTSTYVGAVAAARGRQVFRATIRRHGLGRIKSDTGRPCARSFLIRRRAIGNTIERRQVKNAGRQLRLAVP